MNRCQIEAASFLRYALDDGMVEPAGVPTPKEHLEKKEQKNHRPKFRAEKDFLKTFDRKQIEIKFKDIFLESTQS